VHRADHPGGDGDLLAPDLAGEPPAVPALQDAADVTLEALVEAPASRVARRQMVTPSSIGWSMLMSVASDIAAISSARRISWRGPEAGMGGSWDVVITAPTSSACRAPSGNTTRGGLGGSAYRNRRIPE
jgi:hypothetical protein